MKFSEGKMNRKSKKLWALSFVALLVISLFVTAVLVRKSYNENLKPLSSNSKSQVITIKPGSTASEIAQTLKSKNVIKSDWAFEWYVRTQNVRDDLKAGTYVVDQNQSVQQIVDIIISGVVATDLITILPGKSLDVTKADFVKAGFSNEEVEKALEPSQYAKHPALRDKPKEATLEGYIYPETFKKTAETTLKEIITLSLDEMDRVLTNEIRQAISKQGMTVHEAVILASIVEGEVTTQEERNQAAQVFLKRLKEGIKLESNATDDYAKKNPAYDTYKIDALPPGPISNFTDSAIKAVAFPSKTDWMYFVSGDNGQTHFSKTLEEHEANIQKYCTTLCGR